MKESRHGPCSVRIKGKKGKAEIIIRTKSAAAAHTGGNWAIDGEREETEGERLKVFVFLAAFSSTQVDAVLRVLMGCI